MADKTYDINISGLLGGGSAGGGGGARKPPNSASMDRLLKAIEALVRNQKVDIAKDLKPLFEKLIRQIGTAGGGIAGGTGPRKVSQADVRNIANDLATEVAKQLSRQLNKVYSGAKQTTGGPADTNKILNVINKGLDKQAQAITGQLNTILSRKGINVGAVELKGLEKALREGLQRTVTSKGGPEIRELMKAVSSMKTIASEISKAVKVIGGLRRSGGGVDITEIKDVISTIGKVNRELKQFKESANHVSNTIKKLPGDVKNLKDSLTGVRGAVTKQATGVRERAKEDPQKFARLVAKAIGDTLERSSAFKQSDLGKSWRDFEQTVKNMEAVTNKVKDISSDISKFVKTGQIDTANINKLIDVLSKNVVAKPTKSAPGWYAEKEPPKGVLKEGGKLVKQFKQIATVDIDTSKAKKKVDDLVDYTKDKMTSVTKEVEKGIATQVTSLDTAFKDVFNKIEIASKKRVPILKSLKAAKYAYKSGDIQGAMHKTVKTAQMADLGVNKELSKLKEEVIGYIDSLKVSKTSQERLMRDWYGAWSDFVDASKDSASGTKKLSKTLDDKANEIEKTFNKIFSDMEKETKRLYGKGPGHMDINVPSPPTPIHTKAQIKMMDKLVKEKDFVAAMNKLVLFANTMPVEQVHENMVKLLSSISDYAIALAKGGKIQEADDLNEALKAAYEEMRKVKERTAKVYKEAYKTSVSAEIVAEETGKVAEKTKEVVKETDKAAKKTKDLTKEIEDVKSSYSKGKRIFEKVDFRTKDAGLLQEKKAQFMSARPHKYADAIIEPGKVYKSESKLPSYGKKIKEEAEDNITDLSTSLDKLQKDVLEGLEKGFAEHNTGWGVLDKKFKSVGNQWKVRIADIWTLGKQLGTAMSDAAPEDIFKQYKTEEISKLTLKTPLRLKKAEKIGEWLKNSSLQAVDDLKDNMDIALVDVLKSIKTSKTFAAGEEVSSEMAAAINNRLGDDLKTIFEKTYAKTKVESDIINKKLVREVTLPAAQVSSTGGPIFKTRLGSDRSVPRFAQYSTGFETLYDKMQKTGAFKQKGEYQEVAREIEDIGFRPERTGKLQDAKKLAKKLFTKLSMAGDDEFILNQYKEAATMVGARRQRAGIGNVSDFERKINEAVEDFNKVGGNVIDFMDAMEKYGISTYDVVKSMQRVKFSNVYDIYRKVLKGTEETFEPLKQLAKNPKFDSSIRTYEQAIRSVEQLLPIIEPGKVKRGKHYESMVTTMFQQSPLWQISGEKGGMSKYIKQGFGGIGPEEQKKRIEDINMNLRDYLNEINELYKTGAELTPQIQKRMEKMKLPAGIETLSTLGPPEAQAADYKEYRPTARLANEQKYLKSLGTTSIKLYGQKLLKQAPFGEYGRMGRNVANVTAAMSSFVPLSEEAVHGIPGRTTKFPSLRTTEERDIISSGRYGSTGYGFNVLAELKHTAGTFEDQIIISGKLAGALTKAVSNLIKPSPKGRIGAPLGARGAVTKIEPKTLKDVTAKEIKDASREFMKVLGVPEKYKRDADKALIKDVDDVLTTIRGESVEVQKAKLVEVFMSNFARKFVTRYGTKGVSVQTAGPQGLGVAETPKSMGKLTNELLDYIKKNKELWDKVSKTYTPGMKKAGFTDLKTQLAQSGNKFILDLFSDVTNEMAQNLGVKEEINKQAKIYQRVTKILEAAFNIKLPRDVKGIEELKKLYSEKLGEKGLVTQRPIEMRISAAGIAKRGLQAEFLESIMGNVIGAGVPAAGGKTTVKPTIPTKTMEGLLGSKEQKGLLAKYSKALGYVGAGKTQEAIEKDLMGEGMDKAQAERGAALEAMSNYYTKIKDEYGKAAKSIVGPKFVSIVEEPHQVEGWSPQDIEGLQKGGKLNVPAMSAYETIFGEKSALMKQIKGAGGKTFESQKLMEYLKALQSFNTSKQGKELSESLMGASKQVKLEDLKPFTERTGTFFNEQDVIRNLKGTILDVGKYSTPLTTEIPTKMGKGGKLERTPFYIPGPLARQTYPEEMIAGEVGMDVIARRLQTVINAALKAERATGAAGGEMSGKDIGELDAIIRKGVGKLVKEAQAPTTKPERLDEIAKRLFKGLEDVPVEEAFRTEGKGFHEGITERQYINEFYKRFLEKYKGEGREKPEKEAYKLTIGRMADVLIGPKSGNLLGTPSRVQKVVGTGDIKQMQELTGNLDFNKTSDEELQKRLDELSRARVAYMRSLTEAVIGKTGAIAGTTFLRKTPSVMAKAVSAVVDKTKELKEFSKELINIGTEFDEFSSELPELQKMGDIASAIDNIRKEHAQNVEKYKELGLPVLGQHELGVPKHLAKKVPVTFEKRYDIQGGIPTLTQKPKARTMVDSNLAAMIAYRDTLEKGMKKMNISEDVKRLKDFVDNELTPYIESIRYPFTGISSVQPYKAKILPETRTGAGRNMSKYALAVPGMPELQYGGKKGFNEQIKSLEGLADAADKLREKLYEQADETGVLAEDKIAKLTSLIDTLNKAISDVIPKYAAVQQKLDHDGDMIQVHSGTLAEARKDIEKHYKSMTEYTKGMGGTAQKWRDIWTAGEAVPATSSKYPLADIMKGFEKKWKPEEGYAFLRRPEVTETLDFMKTPEQLKLLGAARAPQGADQPEVLQASADVLKKIVEETITEPGPREQILDKINDTLVEGKKSTEDLVNAVQDIGKTFDTDLSKLVTAGIKDRLYEKKYSDAIVAQLFKLHTGQQTEGVYRLHRLVERRVGFGPGMAGTGGEGGYRPSAEFKKRWPSNLKIFGGTPPEEEVHTFINELERFATQKGMDVKHAGARPVAGEITESLSRGKKGVETLISEINNAGKTEGSDYAQLAEFSEASTKAVKSRLGRMTTPDIIKDIKKLTEARGLQMPKIENRQQAMEEAVKLIGFEGFLKELAMQLEEDAVNAYVVYLKSLAPRARDNLMGSRKGMDLKQFAKERVEYQMSPEGKGLSTAQILKQTEPLYSFRAFGASQQNLADQYNRTTVQSVQVPEEFKKTPDMTKAYKNAQEVSRSIQRTMQEVNQIKGGGTYNDLVVSTLENIYDDQKRLESILNKLKDEGYPIGKTQGIENIGERMFAQDMPEIPSITKELIAPVGEGLESSGKVLDKMKEKVDEYSRLAGVSPLGPEVKRAIEFGKPAEEFAKKAKEKFKNIEDESKRTKAIDKYVENMVKKASAVAQMDKVIDALKTKVKERDFITKLLPSQADLHKMVTSQIESGIETPFRDLLTEQSIAMPTGGRETAFFREEEGQKPTIPGGGPGGGGTAKERLLAGAPKGEAIPVFIVGVAEGIGLTFTPGGTMQGAINTAKVGQPKEDLDAIEKELSALHEKSTGVVKTMRATYEDSFRASALSGGGRIGYKGPRTGPEFQKEQVAAIMKKMMGKEELGHRVKASSYYGTVLHKKIQDMAQKQLQEKSGGKKKYDAERLVEYQDKIGGYISGHADLIEQELDGAGTAVDKKIIDIKTVSKGMVERFKKLGKTDFKDISKMAKEGNLTNYDIKKLNDVASQLNLYIKAVSEANDVAASSLKGEAWFYDREDINNMAKIKFNFDPDRLKRDMEAINEARKSVMEKHGSKGFTEAQHRLDLTRAEQKRKMGVEPLSPDEWSKFSDKAGKYWERTKGMSDWTDYREKDIKFPKMPRSYTERARRERFANYDIPKAPVSGKGVLEAFANLKEWHDSVKEYVKDLSGIGFDTEDFKNMIPPIKKMLEEVEKGGPKGTEFFELLKELQHAGFIQGPELAKAWKYYRIAVGDFFLKEAERASEMEEQFKKSGKLGQAGAEYGKMRSAVNSMKQFIEKGLGKATDIYTHRRRYIRPDLAEQLGLYLSPRQLMERSQGPLDTGKLKGIFEKRLVGDVTAGKKLTAPIQKVRDVVKDLSGADEKMVDLLTDAEKFKRMGGQAAEAWNLDDVATGVVKLRSALQSFLKFKFQEGEDTVERKNLEDTLKLLKSIETAYTAFRGKRKEAGWGEMGLTRVPAVLNPREQEAMHMRNIQRVREYFAKPQKEGGPKPGERYTYNIKVVGELGDVVKSTAIDFKKLGDATNFAGQRIGLYTEKSRDLMKFMQGENRSFGAAIMRAVRWGAASRLIYGGWQQIWDSVKAVADIETGMAKLRMVMSPLETDFDALGKAAVSFAKQYGTSIQSVLEGMKIFAQQGLSQEEVIDRTRVATLAANVTTLSAREATEALTAAMKVFGTEGESAMRFLDSWSEVEARHAITAGDMANAIKKTASAAKNAGVTFDQLNGMIAGIGAVTRQSGREISTGLRFIFRRLYSDKAPKELMKLNIPVLTGGAELRKGYTILNDLASTWKDLTSAQKMNIAQSIGGVRQYNSLLVLMDNWKEVNRAVRDSINSRGSAERRNLELMKTYTKQLEQTKTAAMEVQMAIGKIVLPAFKTGLKAIRTVLDLFTAIPGPVKAAMAAVTAFFTFIAKGDKLIQGAFNFILSGKSKLSQVVTGFYDEFRSSKFEVLGKGAGEAWAKGLKTVSKYSKGGAEQGHRLKDFHTTLGKTKFLAMQAGQAYNRFIGDLVVGSGKLSDSVNSHVKKIAGAVEGLGDKISDVRGMQGLASVLTTGELGPGAIAKEAVGAGIYAAGKGAKAMSDLVFGSIGKYLGKGGRSMLADWANANTGVVKSLLPLITTMGVLYYSMEKAGDYFSKITQNSQDFEKSMYGLRRESDSQITSLQSAISEYDKLSDSVAEYNKLNSSKVAERRKKLGTYESPYLKMGEIMKESIKTANRLGDVNLNLVAGYDKLGNVILKNVGSYKKYLQTLEGIKKEERARAEAKIAVRFVYDLTETGGQEKWKEGIKKILKGIPLGFGKLASNLVKVTPAKAIQDITEQLNKLLSIKNKYPMSTVVDEDVKRLQKALKTARGTYDEIYGSFKEVIAKITKLGLNKNVLAEILSSKELRKGFEVALVKEPRYKQFGIDAGEMMGKGITEGLKKTGAISVEDLIGAQVLKGISPEFSSYIDATAKLTRARLETSLEAGEPGIAPTKKLFAGKKYLATFSKQAGEYIAGNQAIISWKKNVDGLYEAVATYFNKKTLKVEEVPFGPELQKMADAVFPAQRLGDAVKSNINQFNEFVAGAEAGLTGLKAKDFKRQFNLGARFFNQVPTTTVLQGNKGYAPYQGYGASPLQKGWSEDIKKYLFTPMQEYNDKLAQYAQLTSRAVETGKATEVTPEMTEKISKLQTVLKNNQVVFQYRAAIVDLTKTFAESARTLKENIAVEKERLKTVKVVSGALAGVPEDLVNDLDLGVRQAEKLTPHQVALRQSPAYAQGAGLYKNLEQVRKTLISNNENTVKTSEALSNIKQYSKAFGVTLKPEDMEKYAEKVAILGDKGAAAIVLSTDKVAKNTAETNKKLDDILAELGNPSDVDAYIMQQAKNAKTPTEQIDALDRLVRRRGYAENSGDQKSVLAINKQIDLLSKSVVQQVGLTKALEMMDDTFIKFGKVMEPKEFIQRAIPFSQKELYSLLRQRLPGTEIKTNTKYKWSPWMEKTPETMAAIEKDSAKLYELQKKSSDKSFFDSKAIQKAQVAATIYYGLNKKYSNDAIKKYDEQIKILEKQAETAATTGDMVQREAKTRPIVQKIAVLKEARKREQDSADLYGMVRNISAAGLGASTLARMFGTTEKTVKDLGVGAMATYAAFKLLSGLTQKKLPDSVKDFGKSLKDATKEVAAKGSFKDVSLSTKLALKDTGKAMMEDVKKFKFANKQTEKDLKGIDIEELSKSFEKARQSMTDREKKLSEYKKMGPDYKGYANLYEKQMKERVGMYQKEGFAGKGFKDLMAKQDKEMFNYLRKYDDDMRNAILEKFPEQQSAGKDYYENVKKAYKDSIKEGGRETFQANRTQGMYSKGFTKLLAVAIGTALAEVMIDQNKTNYNTKLAQAQQQASAIVDIRKAHPEVFDEIIKDFYASAQKMNEKGLMPTESVKNTLDTTKEYMHQQDNLNNILSVGEKKLELITALHRTLNDTLAAAKLPLGALNKSMLDMGASLRELSSREFTESLASMKEYRDNVAKLFGGGHPLAGVAVSPEQERQASSVGIRLTNLKSTKYDVQKAALTYQAAMGTGGPDIYRQIQDVEEQKRRDIEAYKQQQANRKLLSQTGIYEKQMDTLNSLASQTDLSKEMRTRVDELRKSLADMLAGATKEISQKEALGLVEKGRSAGLLTPEQYKEEKARVMAAGPNQYKGIQLSDFNKLQQTIDQVSKEVNEKTQKAMAELSEKTSQMVKSLEDGKIPTELATQTDELKKQTGFLSGLLDKFTGKETNKKATGGKIFGRGGPKEDKVPAMLSPGEYVIKAAAAKKLGYDKLEYMNEKGLLPTMATGGLIDRIIGKFIKKKSPKEIKKDLTDQVSKSGTLVGETAKKFKEHQEEMAKYRKALGYSEGGLVDRILGHLIKKKKPTPEMLGTGMAEHAGKQLEKHKKKNEEVFKELFGDEKQKKADGGKIKYINPRTGKPFQSSLNMFWDSQRDATLNDIMAENGGLQKSKLSDVLSGADQSIQLYLMNLLGDKDAKRDDFMDKIHETYKKWQDSQKKAEGGKVRHFSDYGLKPGEIYSLKEMEKSGEKYEEERKKQKEEEHKKFLTAAKETSKAMPAAAPKAIKASIEKAKAPEKNKQHSPNLIKQLAEFDRGAGYGIPEYKVPPPKAKPKDVIIPGKKVGPEFFDKAVQMKNLKEKYGDTGVTLLGIVGGLTKKVPELLDNALLSLDKTISGTSFGKMMKGFIKPEIYYPGDDKESVVGAEDLIKPIVTQQMTDKSTKTPTADLDKIAKGVMGTGTKEGAKPSKEDWAIKTASDVIGRMKSGYTTEEYQKYISSYYSDNIIKQMFTNYIKQFGKDGYKQAMLDLDLQSPDPNVFGGTKFGKKGPIRKRYNPFQAQLAIGEGKQKAKELSQQWKLASSKQAADVARRQAGDITTGLTGKAGDLVRYQSMYDPLAGKITSEMYASVGPKKSGAAMADPVYAKMEQDTAVRRTKLQNELISVEPGSDGHKNIQNALDILDKMATLKKGENKKKFKKQYDKLNDKFNSLMEGISKAKVITPESPFFNQLQSRERLYVQMHMRAKSLLGTYEDDLKKTYENQGLDYKGKDKQRYEDELKRRKNNINRELLYTSAVLTQIKSGKSTRDIKEYAMYQNPEGQFRAYKDRFNQLQPRSLVSQLLKLDKSGLQVYQQERHDIGLNKLLKHTPFTAEDVALPGFPIKYLEALKKAGIFGRLLIKFRTWWMSKGHLGPDEVGLSKKDLVLKRIRDFYNQTGAAAPPAKIPFSTGGQVNSMRVMHAGGVVNKTGPVFAQKGEVFFPKGMAEGGPVNDEVSKLMERQLPALKDLTIRIDTKELRDLLSQELKVEDVKLKVDDTPLKVEDKTFTVEDKTFPVEDRELKVEDKELKVAPIEVEIDRTPIKVDTGDLATNIGDSIKAAIANITVKAEMPKGAVGADEFAHISEAVNNVNDKIISLNKDMEDKIEMLGTTGEQNILNKVQGMIKNSIDDTILEIRTTDNVVDSLRSEIQREKNLSDYRITEINRKIGEIYDLMK